MINNRLTEIDIAKGLGIILVVWGHIVARATPLGNQWYEVSKYLVYQFHMPFFIFLAAVIAGYRYTHPANLLDYKNYVSGKFIRLFPGYLLFAMIVVIGKLVTAQFMFVDNLPTSFLAGFRDVLIYPLQSSAGFLWFVYLIFLYYMTLPVWMTLFKRNLPLFLLLAAGCHWLPGPQLFLLDLYFEFFIYFAIGIWVGMNYESIQVWIKKGTGLFLLVFIAALAVSKTLDLQRIWVALPALPALLGLCHRWPLKNSQKLEFLGRYSFAIYLMNALAIGLIKAVGFKFASWDGLNFLIYVPILFLGGLLIPIYLKKYVFRFFPLLDRITT